MQIDNRLNCLFILKMLFHADQSSAYTQTATVTLSLCKPCLPKSVAGVVGVCFTTLLVVSSMLSPIITGTVLIRGLYDGVGVSKLKSRWTHNLCAGLSYTQLLLVEESCLQVWRLECKGDRLVEFKPMHQLKAGGISHKPERGQVHKEEEQVASKGKLHCISMTCSGSFTCPYCSQCACVSRCIYESMLRQQRSFCNRS